MHSGSRIYHRTSAGERALQSGHLGLDADHWALLALVGRATSTEVLQACLVPKFSRADTLRSLEALEGWGLIESVPEVWQRELSLSAER